MVWAPASATTAVAVGAVSGSEGVPTTAVAPEAVLRPPWS